MGAPHKRQSRIVNEVFQKATAKPHPVLGPVPSTVMENGLIVSGPVLGRTRAFEWRFPKVFRVEI